MSAIGKELSKCLDHPEEWEVGRYSIEHKPTGTIWWVGNDSWFFDGDDAYGTPKCLGVFERHWLYWKASKVWRSKGEELKKRLMEKLSRANKERPATAQDCN